MYVTSTGITDGVIADRFGKRNPVKNGTGKVTHSLPFDIHEPPAGTVSYAWVLEDVDAVPVCGFSWIHWLGCDLTETSLGEGASIGASRVVGPEASTRAGQFTQGANSWISPLAGSRSRAESSCYGGMAPPDRAHTYELHVFALDTRLGLEPGFLLNELHWAMQGHVLATATLAGSYDA